MAAVAAVAVCIRRIKLASFAWAGCIGVDVVELQWVYSLAMVTHVILFSGCTCWEPYTCCWTRTCCNCLDVLLL
jgi:hypothetical protein